MLSTRTKPSLSRSSRMLLSLPSNRAAAASSLLLRSGTSTTCSAAGVNPVCTLHRRQQQTAMRVYTTSCAKMLSGSASPVTAARGMSSISLDRGNSKNAENNTSSNASSNLDTTTTTVPASSYTSPPGKNPIPDFNDAKAAFESKSTRQLFTALVTFELCQIPPLVRHAEQLLKWSRRLLGDGLIDAVLKATLFGHFCAGENETKIQPVIQQLQRAGIGSILDFAAESDGSESTTTTTTTNATTTKTTTTSTSSTTVSTTLSDPADFSIADELVQETHVPKVRVYDYESEAECDKHLAVFKKCIHDVASLPADGYAAIKITALTNPALLERSSRAIVEAQNLFAKFDKDQDGFISRSEFEHGFHLFFRDDHTKLRDMLEQLNPGDCNDKVDYITWSMMLQPKDLPSLTAGCRERGPLAMAAPTEEEVELMDKMYARGHALAQEAASVGTRLLIDAEQARFQPAIDNLVLELQRTYNAAATDREFPLIYNTYQCYLKDVKERLPVDVERSERFDYHFGAKLVRGAYMESERALAEILGLPSPIHDTLEDTHNCYNNSVRFLLEHSTKSKHKLEIMLASHNQESIEKAIAAMNDFGIDRKDSTISFAQLYGMMDNLTFNLGQHSYRAFKYLPYGEVKMVMPYLIRRANENSAIAGGAKKEIHMLATELKRRIFG